ncbi:adenylylsulfate kinase [Ignicoccus pacificus DSM 13166]|uniref:Adenylyl-sulfate kinase n=1 Tax=Ignicoccus pacificus DSM 13166 TaxID=940294 RepID=A0A977PKS2_9CREN|nr:adenylylsulfate kinase [Ignicoccus pacificus DSM 13166]
MIEVKCLEKAPVIWLTGLPGSGKSTLAKNVAKKLKEMGYKVEVLDGDWVRKTINPDAGYTKEERARHLRRVAWIARLLARNGVITLCSFVSPYREVRRQIREIVEEEVPFYEIYVKCPVEECIKRDPKGLYKKALRGEIKHFTGISDPYEPPENPDLVIDTVNESVEESTEKLLRFVLDKISKLSEE